MINLDSEEEILKLDDGKILDSIRLLPAQIEQVWKELKTYTIPLHCELAKHIIVCGMGGSALGGRIVRSLISERASIPIEICTEYSLPKYADADTLVILSSYSGNTEETLSVAREALERGCKIFGITTGGKLREFLEENNLPHFNFEPKENPSNQPRMALGYSVASLFGTLARCHFLTVTDQDFFEIIETTKLFIKEFDINKPENENIAKKIAVSFKGKIPILISSEHLKGAVHAFKNQLNENSKTFTDIFDIPELNHHLMEGLRFPANARNLLYFLFLSSQKYSLELKKRYQLTAEVVDKNGYPYRIYFLRSPKKILEVFEILVLGTFVAYYLAILNGINPAPIPWVDYFKQKLSEI